MIQGLEDFKTYNKAMDLGESVWSIVATWSYFEKDTIRKQLVRSCDSIAANLSEGLGRYHFKESRNFSFYARGSLFETRTWLDKAMNRKLIDGEVYKTLETALEVIGKMLNTYIKSIGTVNEPEEIYRNPKPPIPNPPIPNP
jgi:four helix bundle protein